MKVNSVPWVNFEANAKQPGALNKAQITLSADYIQIVVYNVLNNGSVTLCIAISARAFVNNSFFKGGDFSRLAKESGFRALSQLRHHRNQIWMEIWIFCSRWWWWWSRYHYRHLINCYYYSYHYIPGPAEMEYYYLILYVEVVVATPSSSSGQNLWSVPVIIIAFSHYQSLCLFSRRLLPGDRTKN